MEGVAREDGGRWDGANIGGGGMVLTEEGEGGEDTVVREGKRKSSRGPVAHRIYLFLHGP